MANTSKGKSTAKKKSGAKSNSKSKAQASSAKSKKPAVNVEIIDEQQKNVKKQMQAVVIFAVAVFTACLALIPGENFWQALRNFDFGLWGYCAFAIPVLLCYVAYMQSFGKQQTKLGYKIGECIVLIILLCSAFHIFSADISGISLIDDIKEAYHTGIKEMNGGVFGAILGGVLLKLFGKTGAAVTICILMFVVVMLITGTTLVKLARTMKKPVQKVQEYSEVKVRQAAQREYPKARFNIDVDLGPDAPSKDVFADDDEKPDALAEKPKKTRKKPVVNDITELFTEDEPSEEKQEAEQQKPSAALDDIIKKATAPLPKPETETAAGVATASVTANTAPQSGAKSQDEFKVEQENSVNVNYKLPPISLLNKGKGSVGSSFGDELKANANKLVETLKSFGVNTKIIDICTGPSVTRYELQPAVGVKISKITGLADDIALALATSGVRIEAPIPGKAAVGIEVPNKTRLMVTAREIIDTEQFRAGSAKSMLNVALGKDIGGNVICADLSKMPHLLIAGTTGSGKSVCINSMIVSILYNAKPDEVKLLMIDPKQVEFTVYNGIPHLLVPVVSDPHKASGALAWAVKEMLLRYKMFSTAGVRNIKGYNEQVEKNNADENSSNPDMKKMPHIVIFIDEFSDLMMAAPKEIEDSICRLAQMARAAGIHLVIATQRPSVDVITGLIKSNIPSRLSLFVSDSMQSRIILDCTGAEKLLGNGDLLFNPVGSTKPTRIQGCFLSDEEVEKVVNFIKQQSNAEYDEAVSEEIERQAAAETDKQSGGESSSGGESYDDRIEEAIKIVVENGQASATLIQRKLSVGYARAGRIVDQLEQMGIIGPYEGSKPRKVLMTKQQYMEKMAMSSDDVVAQQDVEEEQF